MNENQTEMLAKLADTNLPITERAKLTGEFIEAAPNYRPLPIDIAVIQSIFEQFGMDAGLVAAYRTEEALQKESIRFLVDNRPADFVGNRSLTAAYVEMGRLDEAMWSLLDEYKEFMPKDFVDTLTCIIFGEHVVNTCHALGRERFYRLVRETQALFDETVHKRLLRTFIDRSNRPPAQLGPRQLKFREWALQQWSSIVLRQRRILAGRPDPWADPEK